MIFLHPIFTAVTLILIGYSFLEVNNYKNYKSVWVVIGMMIILIGLRSWVGADYGVYVQMYNYFGENTDYSKILDAALRKSELEVEWVYIFVGKVIYGSGMPFFIFTFVLALFSIGIKYWTFENAVVYPSISMLLYMFPSYFTADGGHMRQAVAMAVAMASFYFIKRRKLLLFLFMIYIAMGFHKSAAIFIPAYWLVLVPLNSVKILSLIALSMILSPFQIYQYISLLDSIAPADVYQGFQAYDTIEEQNTGVVKFTDLISVMYAYFLATYNKEACEKIPYYEYMRNIGIVGICMSFIFRGNPIFSSRLVAYYIIFMVMVLPNIVASVVNGKLRRILHLFLIAYIVFYYFVYATMQAPRAGYTWDRYGNFLW